MPGVGDVLLHDAVLAVVVGGTWVNRRLRGSGRVVTVVASVDALSVNVLAVDDQQLEAAHAGRRQVGVEHLADPAAPGA